MPESSKKSPRQRFREEHAQFLEGLSAGLTDLEIMRRMGWTKLQLKRHQAEAFAAGETPPRVWGRQFPAFGKYKITRNTPTCVGKTHE